MRKRTWRWFVTCDNFIRIFVSAKKPKWNESLNSYRNGGRSHIVCSDGFFQIMGFMPPQGLRKVNISISLVEEKS